MNAALFKSRKVCLEESGVPGPPAIEKMPVRNENVFLETIANFPVTHYNNARNFWPEPVKISIIPWKW